ncbi:hypothetical protein P9139_17935 [Curtobacterium flaccumfaciens]|nr:hypothetical protein P9139_17935 [Curtobacterium flaccumfaciens]
MLLDLVLEGVELAASAFLRLGRDDPLSASTIGVVAVVNDGSPKLAPRIA